MLEFRRVYGATHTAHKSRRIYFLTPSYEILAFSVALPAATGGKATTFHLVLTFFETFCGFSFKLKVT